MKNFLFLLQNSGKCLLSVYTCPNIILPIDITIIIICLYFSSAKILLDDGRVLVPLEVIHNTKPSVFHGIGENKHQAKLAAAKMALRFFHEKYQDV